jgi:hypothetical protein
MQTELEKSEEFYKNKMYDKALEILLVLENKEIGNKALKVEILEAIYRNFKAKGNLESAFLYYKKFSDEEYEKIFNENKEKTEKLNSALKIHSSQKETALLQGKNNELQEANTELNLIREKKNNLIKTVSEDLKVPILTIEGISLKNFKNIADGKEINFEIIRNDLEEMELLSRQVLENVNSILEKNKAEHNN